MIETINKGFPLNVMYWAVREDETYEVIDGQQRTISVAQYVKGDYSLDLDFDGLRLWSSVLILLSCCFRGGFSWRFFEGGL